MKTKTRKPTRYRGNKQTGESLTLTSVVPRAVAVVVNAEAMLRNRSVSVIVAEIITERYFENGDITKRKSI